MIQDNPGCCLLDVTSEHFRCRHRGFCRVLIFHSGDWRILCCHRKIAALQYLVSSDSMTSPRKDDRKFSNDIRPPDFSKKQEKNQVPERSFKDVCKKIIYCLISTMPSWKTQQQIIYGLLIYTTTLVHYREDKRTRMVQNQRESTTTSSSLLRYRSAYNIQPCLTPTYWILHNCNIM